MTPDEYFRTVRDRIKNDLQASLDTVIGAGALALIDQRVRTKGTKADGGQFSPYSTKDTLIGAKSFTSKTYSDKVFGKEKNKDLEWRTVKGHHLAILHGGYRRIREIEGRQVAHKDFERTSALWKSIHVIGTKEISPDVYQTTVGTENPLSINKMLGVRKQEATDLLKLSPQEEQRLTQILADRLHKLMQ